MADKVYWRVYNTLSKKYERHIDNSYLVFEYLAQAENWIAKRLGGSKIYVPTKWKPKSI